MNPGGVGIECRTKRPGFKPPLGHGNPLGVYVGVVKIFLQHLTFLETKSEKMYGNSNTCMIAQPIYVHFRARVGG